MGRFKALKL